ncbi:hypothetical protein [Ectobacillus sp. sgz5001026]|uniref:hypothetical protein n=1 Tax=Ectobacillus sp. sgz5001026 TaxID=3242473 RepID=UPI0036D3F327
MIFYDEMMQEWRRLWDRMLELEKKVEESIQVSEAWYVCKRIVYEINVVIPFLLLLEVARKFTVEEFAFSRND